MDRGIWATWYELEAREKPSSLKAAEANLADPSDWTRRVIGNLVHAPHSPTLGVRIWPPGRGG